MAKKNMCVQGEGLLVMPVEGRLHGETEHFLKRLGLSSASSIFQLLLIKHTHIYFYNILIRYQTLLNMKI